MMSSWTTHVRTLAASIAAATPAILLAACGSDTAGPEEPVPLSLPAEWTFESGPEGWTLGASGGSAEHEASEGNVLLSGAGNPGVPNSWMSLSVQLPDVPYLWIDATVSINCPGGDTSDSSVRITAASPEQGTVVVRDWSDVDENSIIRGGSLEQFAGQTVTITIEQDDEGEQEESDDPEVVCVEMVSIFQD